VSRFLQSLPRMRHQHDIVDEPEELPAADHSPGSDSETEWSDEDFGMDEDVDPTDRRRDPLRR